MCTAVSLDQTGSTGARWSTQLGLWLHMPENTVFRAITQRSRSGVTTGLVGPHPPLAGLAALLTNLVSASLGW